MSTDKPKCQKPSLTPTFQIGGAGASTEGAQRMKPTQNVKSPTPVKKGK